MPILIENGEGTVVFYKPLGATRKPCHKCRQLCYFEFLGDKLTCIGCFIKAICGDCK